MIQNWIDQLKSDDPRVRAEAVKQLALSGDKDNLRFLREVVENDPDPQLQEYAKKAARHLYTSDSTLVPPRTTPDPAPEPARSETDMNKISEMAQIEAEEESLSSADKREAANLVQRAFTLHTSDRTHKAIPIFVKALELNPELVKEPYPRSVAGELTGKSPEQALHLLKDPDAVQELIDEIRGKDKKGKKGNKASTSAAEGKDKKSVQTRKEPSGLIQTWLSFFFMTESFFDREQERANTEDTLLSLMVYTIATVVISMVTGIFQLQQITTLMGEELPQLGFNMGTIFFFILIGTVIMSPISFYASVGLQFLGVRIFGGSGDFKSHAYLMALVLVPTTVLGGVVSLLSFVPVIGFLAGLAGFGLSIFTIILTVRLIKSVHNVPTGKAVAGIVIPPIVLSALFGCLFLAFGSALIGSLGLVQ